MPANSDGSDDDWLQELLDYNRQAGFGYKLGHTLVADIDCLLSSSSKSDLDLEWVPCTLWKGVTCIHPLHAYISWKL
jgi:plasmid maintenance system killer protein